MSVVFIVTFFSHILFNVLANLKMYISSWVATQITFNFFVFRQFQFSQ